ncbi:MAG: hypothetical protein IJI66_02880 [Erysipelotrichaceae bacterium]|nr:hypothetical protein [Erysipelotrichaceae bacterium]
MNNTDTLNEVCLDYSPFFQLMEEKGLTYRELRARGLSPMLMKRMREGKNMTIAMVGRVMKIMGVRDVKQIVRMVINHRMTKQ